LAEGALEEHVVRGEDVWEVLERIEARLRRIETRLERLEKLLASRNSKEGASLKRSSRLRPSP